MTLPNHSKSHSRPTISLALIVKNEAKNLPRLFDSVEGCFDEIIVVDTGSTDATKELAKARGAVIYDFEWVDSFCKARNFAFSKCTKDYIVWLDADDVLHTKESFIKWRDYAMAYSDMWLAAYDYAVDQDLNPIISFVRERVFKRALNPVWQYDLHEGIIPKPEWTRNFAVPWRVKHLRDQEDINADRSRNITILEKMVKRGDIDARMQFYYGKELFEAGRPDEAIHAFDKAIQMPGLEHYDKILSYQYGAYSCITALDQKKPELVAERKRLFDWALDFAHSGIKADPNRAEFHALLGDAYLRIGNLAAAVPYFAAAKACLKNFDSPFPDAIYSFKHLYGEAPSVQLAKIYCHLGLLEKAKKEALECVELYKSEEAQHVLTELEKVTRLVTIKNNQAQTEDIVFTTPPQTAYEFDEEIYKTKPLGGSETALVQMAKLLKEKTGRRVLVFNMREKDLIAPSGVEYVSNKKLAEYFSVNKPRIHIAWRHNAKITDAYTYLWCHDLFTPTVEAIQNFDKFLALSPFHKDYTVGLQGVSEDKIIVTRNGIDPEKFKFERKEKNPNKIVWMSSPDRGLDRCMLVLDEVKKDFPNIELHVYYGIEHLHRYGPQMAALAEKLKAMMSERSYVKYHGNTEQNKMYRDVSDAVIWSHPNNFIETYCITAPECLANGIFPVVRRLGALRDTLAEAESNGSAMLLDYDWEDPKALQIHADAVKDALSKRAWEAMAPFDLERLSWASLADEWIKFMNLKDVSEAAS